MLLNWNSFDFLKNPIPLLVFSGLSLFLSQLAVMFWWGGVIGVFLFVVGLSLVKSYKTVVWAGLFVGLLKCLGGFIWFWNSFPVAWLSVDSIFLQTLVVGFVWLMSAIFMGTGMILPALVAYHWRSSIFVLFLVFPTSWLIGEVLGSFMFSLWTLGSGAHPNIYMSHGYAGLPLANFGWSIPVIMLGGLYALTYLNAFLGVVLVACWRRLRFGLYITGSTLAVLIVMNILITPSEHSNVVGKFFVVETSFDSASQRAYAGYRMKGDSVSKAVQAALSEAGESKAIILLPEDSRFTSGFSSPEEALLLLNEIAPESKSLLVDSARVDTEEGAILRAFYYDLATDNVYAVDKQVLVPAGEYVTYPVAFLLKILGQKELLTEYGHNQNYIKGPSKNYDSFPNDFPGILFCFESSYALGVQNLSFKRDHHIVLHPVSHAKFHEPEILRYQLDLMLKIQAVWSAKLIVSAANMSPSKSYYPDSRVEEGEPVSEGRYWKLKTF